MNLPNGILNIISEYGYGEKRQCLICYREEDEIDDCFDNGMCEKCRNPMMKCPECHKIVESQHLTFCLLCRKRGCRYCVDICCDIYSTSDTDFTSDY